MRETEIAYLAGFFDGEGCIQINKVGTELAKRYNKNGRYYLMVSVNQVNPAPLEILQKSYNGTIGPHAEKTSTKRKTWVWRVQGKHADKFLEDILPYLLVKKEEALVALQFRETFWPNGRKHRNLPLTDEEISKREEYRLKIRDIKKREF